MSILCFTLGQPAFVYLGIFAVAAAFRHAGFDAVSSGCLGLVAIGSAAYAAMAISYFALPHATVQLVFLMAAVAVVVWLTVLAVRRRQWGDELVIPALMGLIATYACLAITYIGHTTENPLFDVMTRWLDFMPSDNLIPYHLAEAFKAGDVPTGSSIPVMGDWQFSDRPPLQTALFMLTPGYACPVVSMWAYEAAAVAFQGFSLYAVWLFVRAFCDDARVPTMAMLAAAFTPLVIVNGGFVWPKLLAGGYTLVCAVMVLRYAGKRSIDLETGLLIGSAAALAMLAHGGSIFALMGIGIAAAIFGRWPALGPGLAASVCAVVLYAPWVVYQRLVDPPGDRLLKWHLAGIVAPDKRSIVTALRDAYGGLGIKQILAARWVHVGSIFRSYADTFHRTWRIYRELVTNQPAKVAQDLHAVREEQFFHVAASVGLLGLGFILLPLIAWWDAELRPACVAVLATLAVWMLLIFEPGGTVVHQGAFFPQLATIAIVLIAAARVSWYFGAALVVLQMAPVAFQYGL